MIQMAQRRLSGRTKPGSAEHVSVEHVEVSDGNDRRHGAGGRFVHTSGHFSKLIMPNE